MNSKRLHFIFLLMLAIGLCFPLNSFAKKKKDKTSFFTLDPMFSAAYGKIGLGGTNTPTLAFGSAGAFAKIKINRFLYIGVMSEYSYSMQKTDVDGSAGDRSGSRLLEYAYAVKLRFGKIAFFGNMQSTGNYTMTSSTVNGESLSYSSPKGFKVGFIKHGDKEKLFYWGVYYERVKYSKETLNSTIKTLSSPLLSQQYGFFIGTSFWK